MKTISVKKDKKTNDFYLDLNDFKDFLDVSKIKYYEMKSLKEGFSIKFFDKNKKQIKLKS